MTPRHILLSGLLFVSGPLRAQEATAPWTVADYVFREQVSDVRPSPDGRKALWLKRTADRKKDRYVTRLQLADLESGTSRQLLFGEDGQSAPRWSPDGTRIAFLTPRKPPRGDGDEEKGGGDGDDDDEKQQVWVLRLDGGEPWPVTELPEGVEAFRWVTPKALLVSARERKALREVEAEKRKDETVVVEDSTEFREEAVRLFRVDLEDGAEPGEAERVTTNPDKVEAFEPSPDGKRVVYVRITSPTYEADEREKPRVFLRDLGGGAERELFTDRKNRPLAFVWRPDGSGFYALVPVSSVDGESSAPVLAVYDVPAAGGAPADVPLEWPAGVAADGVVPVADGFLALLREGVKHRAARFAREGGSWRRTWLEGTHAARIFEIGKAEASDRVVYVTGSASDPDRWCAARLDGAALREEKEWLRPADGFKDRRLARTEVIRWKGALDEEVEGILFHPAGHEPGRKYPLVLMPHGGPHAADLDRWAEDYAYAPNLHAERGAFCLQPNYHGSEGYGLAFGESIKGRTYELELVDLLAGVDRLVRDGLVDPERLGLAGWSYGAILSIGCLTLADVHAPRFDYRFKVCVPGAGDVNWTSDYGPCAFGAVYDDYYLGGPPWKLPEVYVRKSPLFHAEKVTTPTLIFFGDQDTSVPTGQGWEWYRALQQIGKAPVRFLLFPGAEHGLRKPSYCRRKLEEEMAWFDRHLHGRPPAKVAWKEDSPLASALAAKEYARVEGRIGVVINGVLAPETVTLDGLEVGRTEVTRAQWQAVFPELHVAAGEEDHPVTGIGAAEALEYVRRLSEKTGRTWRLLTEKEFEDLPAGDRENTLDDWAGWELTPDAVPEVRARAADLAVSSDLPPLLERAGSRPPGVKVSDGVVVRIHDAGGNAAEWVIDDDGKPVLRGGWAFGSSDAHAPEGSILPAYAGLRVARF